MTEIKQVIWDMNRAFHSLLGEITSLVIKSGERNPEAIQQLGRSLRAFDPDFLEDVRHLIKQIDDIISVQIDAEMFAAARPPRDPFVEYVDTMLRPALEKLSWWFDTDEVPLHSRRNHPR